MCEQEGRNQGEEVRDPKWGRDGVVKWGEKIS